MFIKSINILSKSIAATTCTAKINHALNEDSATSVGNDSVNIEQHIYKQTFQARNE